MEVPVGALGSIKSLRGKEIFSELTPQSELEAPKGAPAVETRPVRAEAVSPPRPAGRKKTDPLAIQAAARDRHIRTSVLSFSNMHETGDLFASYLRARKQVFIDQKGWNLPVEDGMEFDQYDTPQARWVVIHEFGKILAGVRIMPTTARCGQHSYMIRDAQKGLLEGLPYDVLFFEAPVDEDIWEGTRLFVCPDVPAEQRVLVNALLFQEMAQAVREAGANYMIGIVPVNHRRWMSRLGLSSTPVGPAMMIDGEKVQAALLKLSPDAPDLLPGLL